MVAHSESKIVERPSGIHKRSYVLSTLPKTKFKIRTLKLKTRKPGFCIRDKVLRGECFTFSTENFKKRHGTKTLRKFIHPSSCFIPI